MSCITTSDTSSPQYLSPAGKGQIQCSVPEGEGFLLRTEEGRGGSCLGLAACAGASCARRLAASTIGQDMVDIGKRLGGPVFTRCQ